MRRVNDASTVSASSCVPPILRIVTKLPRLLPRHRPPAQVDNTNRAPAIRKRRSHKPKSDPTQVRSKSRRSHCLAPTRSITTHPSFVPPSHPLTSAVHPSELHVPSSYPFAFLPLPPPALRNTGHVRATRSSRKFFASHPAGDVFTDHPPAPVCHQSRSHPTSTIPNTPASRIPTRVAFPFLPTPSRRRRRLPPPVR